MLMVQCHCELSVGSAIETTKITYLVNAKGNLSGRPLLDGSDVRLCNLAYLSFLSSTVMSIRETLPFQR